MNLEERRGGWAGSRVGNWTDGWAGQRVTGQMARRMDGQTASRCFSWREGNSGSSVPPEVPCAQPPALVSTAQPGQQHPRVSPGRGTPRGGGGRVSSTAPRPAAGSSAGWGQSGEGGGIWGKENISSSGSESLLRSSARKEMLFLVWPPLAQATPSETANSASGSFLCLQSRALHGSVVPQSSRSGAETHEKGNKSVRFGVATCAFCVVWVNVAGGGTNLMEH